MIISVAPHQETRSWSEAVFAECNEEKGCADRPKSFCYEYLKNGERLGLIKGNFFAGWCRIEELLVVKEAQRQGIGRNLMAFIERKAEEKKCVGLLLTTISFQAPEFYGKMGFECFAAVTPYAGDHERQYFKKMLVKESI